MLNVGGSPDVLGGSASYGARVLRWQKCRPGWRGALGLVVPLLALGGFGADDNRAVGATYPPAVAADKRPSKSEFVRRLARLCDARHRAVISLGVPFTSPRDYARRGSDLIRIERNADRAQHALPRPADHRLIDLAEAQYHRYLHLLPALVRSARHHERRAWLLMYDAQGSLANASDLIQEYGGRRFCNLGP
jgi:hypothetical protein